MSQIGKMGSRLALGAAAVIVGVVLTRSVTMSGDSQVPREEDKKEMKYNQLTPEEERIIIHKGTETPFTGLYLENKQPGTYICRRCNAPLYNSEDKFDSHCGWPSFDDEIPGAVKRTIDADGIRTEITCARCGAHLGHVFEGEGLTDKNVRHCVNSISMGFIPEGQEIPVASGRFAGATSTGKDREVKTEKGYFAGGCFWGVEHYLRELPGVISTTVGYMGGSKTKPTYKEVCEGKTGHAETVEVVFDPAKTDYETVAKYFFEIHDPTQVDRQGPDIGEQYRSVVFYTDDNQKKIADKLIGILIDKGYKVATRVVRAENFWEAEDYHQDYYEVTGKQPYCHIYTKRF
jgi:peptide methionine sulfoxide reductase msrA/msrB